MGSLLEIANRLGHLTKPISIKTMAKKLGFEPIFSVRGVFGLKVEMKQLGESGFYTNEEFTHRDGVFFFKVDNPVLYASVKLRSEYANWYNGLVPQEIIRSGLVCKTFNCKMYVIPDDDAQKRGTELGKVQVNPVNLGKWTAPDELMVRLDGIMLGYEPSSFTMIITQPREVHVSIKIKSPTIALSAETLLVPIEVKYFYHDKSIDGAEYPKKSLTEGDFRMIFDGVPSVEPLSLDNTYWEGEVKTTNKVLKHELVSSDNTIFGFRTPDSVFKNAGVAFRLVKYSEKGVTRERTYPQPDDSGGRDEAAFIKNVNEWLNQISNENGNRFARVLFMHMVTNSDAPEAGITTKGIAGVSLEKGDSLCHEIGHLAGLAHLEDELNLMHPYSFDYNLNQNQIEKMRDWATKFQYFWV